MRTARRPPVLRTRVAWTTGPTCPSTPAAGDARPPLDPGIGGPLHRLALPRLGRPVIDVADPTELAAACVEGERATFLVVAAPPRSATTCLPVNPLAIF
jgi:hypothetical protein